MNQEIYDNFIDTAFIDKLGLFGKVYGSSTIDRVESMGLFKSQGWTKEIRKGAWTGKYFKEVDNFYLWVHAAYRNFGISYCPGKVLNGSNQFYISHSDFLKSVELARGVYVSELMPLFGMQITSFRKMRCTRMDIANNVIVEGCPFNKQANHEALMVFKRQGHKRMEREEYEEGYVLHNNSRSLIFYDKAKEMEEQKRKKQQPEMEDKKISIWASYIRIETQFKASVLGKIDKHLRCIDNLDDIFLELRKVHLENLRLHYVGKMYQSRAEVIEYIKKSGGRKNPSKLIRHIDFSNSPAKKAIYPNKALELYRAGKHPSYYNYNKLLGDIDFCPFYSDTLAGSKLIAMRNGKKETMWWDFILAKLWIRYIYSLMDSVQ